MADIKEIKGHIKRIEDTRKVTKAMYLISSVKYRKAKEMFLDFVPYFKGVEEEVEFVSRALDESASPFLYSACKKAACLVVTADKGLAGDYNKNILKAVEQFRAQNPGALFFVIGGKGQKFFEKNGIAVSEYIDCDLNTLTQERNHEICGIFLDLFLRNEIGRAYAIYTATGDGIRSSAEIKQFLPVSAAGGVFNDEDFEFLPDKKNVSEHLIPFYLDGVIYSVLIQSFFSEQSARMTAMDSADSNAGDMLDELNLQYNHLRQNAITQEITEISGERK